MKVLNGLWRGSGNIMTNKTADDLRIAVIGLGYVGLPLAVEFAKGRPVLGFDISAARIAALISGVDHTGEVETAELAALDMLQFSGDPRALAACNTFIVTVPTPIDSHKRPDISLLLQASETVGRVLKKGDLVIYESTVYPGATEEDCVPVLEKASGLTFNRDFFAGYSPERINPGDKTHRLPSICKVTSGSTPEIADLVDDLYASIITAGTHKVGSIRVAEASKVIENTQRDINIALVNEFAIIFNKMGIDTGAVLEAAGTKWNFLPFRPGLVGGHCIGVDPYYLTHKAEQIGYRPEIILAGRRLNDRMGEYVANRMIREMLRQKIQVGGARVLVMGLTFKENCPDLRNSRVIDVIEELRDSGVVVDVIDPCADPADAMAQYEIALEDTPKQGAYDGIILAVAHEDFKTLIADLRGSYGKKTCVIYDLKHMLPVNASDLRL